MIFSTEEVEVTWAEAEDLFPGCSAEWDCLCEDPGDLPSPSGHEVNLRAHPVDLGANAFSYVIIASQTDGEWYLPPAWVREPSGGWHYTAGLSKPDYELSEAARVQRSWIEGTCHNCGETGTLQELSEHATIGYRENLQRDRSEPVPQLNYTCMRRP